MRLLFIALSILLLNACSPLKLFNAFIPSSGFTKMVDIAYGELARQRLDVYVPQGARSKPRAVVVFFYGGSWDSGSKDEYLLVAEALTSKGFITVIPDYRIYPEVLFPGFLEDGARALRWVKDNAAQFGGDAQSVFVMGHSAGAHIAAMLTFNESYLTPVGLTKADIKGFIGLAGPYDFLPLTSERLKIIFGPEAHRSKSQPINFVVGNEAPVLLIYGGKDTTVRPHNSPNLAQRIRARGGEATEVHFPEMNHIAALVDLSAPLRESGDGKLMLERVAEFITNTAAKKSPAP